MVAEQDWRWKQLWVTFCAELDERVQTLNQLVQALTRSNGSTAARGDTFNALFREVHSLKGAARAVELAQVEQWAQALEVALDAARQSADHPSRVWLDAVSSVVATFSQLAQAGDGASLPAFPEVLGALDGQVSGQVGAAEAAPMVEAAETQDTSPPAGAKPGHHATVTAPTASTAGVQPPAESVRVSVGKLDALLAQAGELAVTHIRIAQRLGDVRELQDTLHSWRREWRACRGLRASLRRLPATARDADVGQARDLEALLRFTEHAEERSQHVLRQVEELAAQLRRDVTQLGLVTQGMEAEVLAVRLLPVSTIFAPLERVVRDLARAQGKQIRLLLEGQETEIDRKILEQLRDPLLHMVRNAVDHGIERPEVRQARGKPCTGAIRLAAAQRGDTIEIALEDDGTGLDPAQLRQSAVRKGFLPEDQAQALDHQSAIELIFRTGFSTKTTITEVSGRGVGMDVVREHLERLSGRITTTSIPGQGTRFIIRVPLTLATTRAILVEQSGQLYAIPSSMIERTSRVQERHLVRIEGRQAVIVQGHPVPTVELADALERTPSAVPGQDAARWRPFFILHQDARRVALLADQLVGEQEIVVRRLGWPLRRVRNVGGAAVLGSGQTVAILNPRDLLKTALQLAGARERSVAVEASSPPSAPRRRRVLVVDDSLPTRTLERSILEVAGYQTLVASDGREALTILRSEPIDLVVSDIEMPGLDGFALTTEIRRDEKLRQIPVVLVTSLAAREHRERGVVAGADAYLVKSNFDQGQLLDTVGRLIA